MFTQEQVDKACEQYWELGKLNNYKFEQLDKGLPEKIYNLLQILKTNGTAASSILRMLPPPLIFRYILVEGLIKNPSGATYLLHMNIFQDNDYDRFFHSVINNQNTFLSLASSLKYHPVFKDKYMDLIIDKFITYGKIEWLEYLPLNELSSENLQKLEPYLLMKKLIEK